MTPTDPDQQEKLKALRRLAELRKNYGIFAYRPQPKQALFHQANYKYRYLRTGNRFGRSTCGSAEDCAFALGARLWLPEGDPIRHLGIPRRATKGVILVADWDKGNIVRFRLGGRCEEELLDGDDSRSHRHAR